MTSTPPRLGHTVARLAATLTPVLVVGVVVLHAASPVFWRVATQADLLKGDATNVSIDADGRVTLGPETTLLHESDAPFLWAATWDDDVLWVGSGSDGKLLRIADDGSVTTVFDAEHQNIHAVTVAEDGSVIVATSPDGAVYRITETGAVRLFEPDEKYIWAVAVAPNGDVYVGTGDKGRIYRIPSNGEASLFYDADATHVLALTYDRQGRLLAGTGSPGQVLTLDDTGRAFVLLDTGFTEVRALRHGPDDLLYAVAVGESPARTQPAPAPASRTPAVPTVTTSTTVTAVVVADAATPAASSTPTTSSTSSAHRGAVYRIQPDGVWDTVWESSEDSPYDVAFNEAGHAIVGTGGQGKIFEISDDPPNVVLLTRAPAEQVTGFATGAGGARYYITSNPGRVYRLAGTRVTEGFYESEIRDAETVATWGTLRWHATSPPNTTVRLFSRSGNTSTPNDTWSRWSVAYTDAAGAQISSPKARYLQWKAELSGRGETPTLLSVTAAYLPQNLRPEITHLTVHEPGVVFQQPFSSGDAPIAGLDDLVDARTRGDDVTSNGNTQPQTTLGRRVYRKGLQTFVWTATDPNKDALSFDVLYRAENERRWQVLRSNVADSIFTWDTTSVPDGTYVVRVVASDAHANAPGAARTGAAESTPFDIDNSAPRIDIEPARRDGASVVVLFDVHDSHSAVDSVEYSLDADRWHVIYPLDGIADSRSERFELILESDQLEHVVIRATDALHNAITAAPR